MKNLFQYRIFFLLTFCLLFVNGCERKPPATLKRERISVEKEIGYGTLTDRTFTNEYFHLKLVVPKNWNILSKAQLEKNRARIDSEISERNNPKDASRSFAKSLQLLIVTKLPFGTRIPGTYNDNLTIKAEQIGEAEARDSNGGDYLRNVIKMMNAEQKVLKNETISRGYKIGSLPAFRMQCDAVLNGGNQARLLIYSSVVKNYVLSVSMVASDEDGLKQLEAIFKSIEASAR